MKIKPNVYIENLCPELRTKLDIIEKCCIDTNNRGYEMTITSGNDGKHKRNSKHYTNEAIDIRCFDMIDKFITHALIKRTLGINYDVILEKDHIHIEYDPKL